MCNQIIQRLKSPNDEGTIRDTETNSPATENGFPSQFIDILFSADVKREASENKAAMKKIAKKDEVSISSTAKTCDHEVLLKEVRALPQERRRSLLLSTIDRLIGLDENETTNEKLSNRSEETDSTKIESNGSISSVLNFTNECNKNAHDATCISLHLLKKQKDTEKENTTKNQGSHRTLEGNFRAGSFFGVYNNGFDRFERESRPWTPDQITVTNIEQSQTNEITSKSPEMDRSSGSGTSMKNNPFVVSRELDSALQAAPGPRTVRAWFKDPNLYKVIYSA